MGNEILPLFKARGDFAYVTINVDKDRKIWQNSISSGKYTTSNYINLNTNGLGE